MSNIILGAGPSGSGSLTLQAPNTNSNQIHSLPDRTGNVTIDGPCFIAYGNADQTIASDTATKIQYNVERADTNNCYDTSNYRFTPNVAGYYWVHAFFEYQGSTPSTYLWSAWIYKNGGSWKRAQMASAQGGNWKCEVQSLVYMNGTTDYLEIYTYHNYGSGRVVYNSNSETYNGFEGYLVRAA
jgi:hypothetical protein